MKFFNPLRKNQNGDTIIEVLISVSILALVLVITYSSTSRSLQQGTNATNRQQATSLAEQQVELIKNGVATDTSHYVPNADLDFCVKPGDSTPQTTTTQCVFGDSSATQYTVIDHYAKATGLYTVQATWMGNGTNGNDQLTVFYRAANPNNFASTCPSGQTGTPPDNCQPISCPTGETGIPPDDCHPIITCPPGETATPSGGCVPTITCPTGEIADSSGNCVPIAAPNPVILKFNASTGPDGADGQWGDNSHFYLTWSSQNATSCAASDNADGSNAYGDTSANLSANPPAFWGQEASAWYAPTPYITYYLTCYGASGTTPAHASTAGYPPSGSGPGGGGGGGGGSGGAVLGFQFDSGKPSNDAFLVSVQNVSYCAISGMNDGHPDQGIFPASSGTDQPFDLGAGSATNAHIDCYDGNSNPVGSANANRSSGNGGGDGGGCAFYPVYDGWDNINCVGESHVHCNAFECKICTNTSGSQDGLDCEPWGG